MRLSKAQAPRRYELVDQPLVEQASRRDLSGCDFSVPGIAVFQQDVSGKLEESVKAIVSIRVVREMLRFQ